MALQDYWSPSMANQCNKSGPGSGQSQMPHTSCSWPALIWFHARVGQPCHHESSMKQCTSLPTFHERQTTWPLGWSLFVQNPWITKTCVTDTGYKGKLEQLTAPRSRCGWEGTGVDKGAHLCILRGQSAIFPRASESSTLYSCSPLEKFSKFICPCHASAWMRQSHLSESFSWGPCRGQSYRLFKSQRIPLWQRTIVYFQVGSPRPHGWWSCLMRRHDTWNNPPVPSWTSWSRWVPQAVSFRLVMTWWRHTKSKEMVLWRWWFSWRQENR